MYTNCSNLNLQRERCGHFGCCFLIVSQILSNSIKNQVKTHSLSHRCSCVLWIGRAMGRAIGRAMGRAKRVEGHDRLKHEETTPLKVCHQWRNGLWHNAESDRVCRFGTLLISFLWILANIMGLSHIPIINDENARDAYAFHKTRQCYKTFFAVGRG